jgi:hypothetical protein
MGQPRNQTMQNLAANTVTGLAQWALSLTFESRVRKESELAVRVFRGIHSCCLVLEQNLNMNLSSLYVFPNCIILDWKKHRSLNQFTSQPHYADKQDKQ